jgi:hypothetical protein
LSARTQFNDLAQAIVAGDTVHLRCHNGQDLETRKYVRFRGVSTQIKEAMRNIAMLHYVFIGRAL